jgi:predicted metal-dependent peptidase
MNDLFYDAVRLARATLLVHKPYFGHITLYMDCVAAAPGQLPEFAGVVLADDNHTVIIDPEFFLSLPLPLQCGILAHEGGHLSLHHLLRRGSRDPILYTLACDLVVNTHLILSGIKLPDEAFTLKTAKKLFAPFPIAHYERLAKMSAEAVYEILAQRYEQSDARQQLAQFALHFAPGRDLMERPPTPTPAQEKITSRGHERPQRMLPADWDRVAKSAEHFAEKSIGESAGSLSRSIALSRKVRLSWWHYVVAYLRPTDQRPTFRRPNRRVLYIDDTILPTLTAVNPSLAIALDCSGSISNEEFEGFINNVWTVINDMLCTVRLLICDAAIQTDVTIIPGEPLPAVTYGGGGTDFNPVFRTLNADYPPPDVLVYLTDGAGWYPKHPPTYPVVWVLTPDHDDPPWGTQTLLEFMGGRLYENSQTFMISASHKNQNQLQ